ncbi:MAG TPA: type II toxin-antitoxin system death-on-curing family toxin [Herpetosiphonaceae bacterium]|nr:type II toxin-antitoxin system death-on-curing family toxin [Herpetosiphonaceae bacterium]
MNYLSHFDLLQIRTRLQAGAPQPFDLMNPNALHAALAAPRQTVFGHDAHPGITSKAAILFIRLINNHPFYDGNKRIAAAALRLFLERNGVTLNVSEADTLSLARRMVTGEAEELIVEQWIAIHSEAASTG